MYSMNISNLSNAIFRERTTVMAKYFVFPHPKKKVPMFLPFCIFASQLHTEMVYGLDWLKNPMHLVYCNGFHQINNNARFFFSFFYYLHSFTLRITYLQSFKKNDNTLLILVEIKPSTIRVIQCQNHVLPGKNLCSFSEMVYQLQNKNMHV